MTNSAPTSCLEPLVAVGPIRRQRSEELLGGGVVGDHQRVTPREPVSIRARLAMVASVEP